MKLFDIFLEIAHVENGLRDGVIDYTWDKLMCVLQPGHPADILDDIIYDVGNELVFHPETKIDKATLEDIVASLEHFKANFEIEELDLPTEHLKEYVKKMKD